MPNVLSDLIWVKTDCVNVITRRTVARKLNACWSKLFQKDISRWQNVAGR